MLSKQCPKCGKSEEQSKFIGAFCPACFAIQYKLYSFEDAEIDRCQKCGNIREGKKWVKSITQMVQKAAEAKVKLNYPAKVKARIENSDKGYLATTTISLNVEGNIIEKVEKINVRINKTQCPECSRLQGGYHEAVIQIRGDNHVRVAEKISKFIEKSTTHIVKIIEQKNGIDFQVGNKQVALAAANSAAKHLSITNKLVGEKDGKRLQRMTILIRLDEGKT